MQKLMMVQDEKWFNACGCQSIKIMYIKDYFQNFRAIRVSTCTLKIGKEMMCVCAIGKVT